MEFQTKVFLEIVKRLDDFNRSFGAELNRPNFFAAAGLLGQEIRHSSILAFLLDPAGWHGLDESFLREFIHLALEGVSDFQDADAFELALGNINDAVVSREVPVNGEVGKGRLDILIASRHSKLLLVIENKVHASQSPGQLKNYKKWIAEGGRWSAFERKLYVYLVLDKSEAAEAGWVKITYEQLLATLQKCVAREPLMPELGKLFIQQYIDLINGHIMKNDSPEMIDRIRRLWAEYPGLLAKIVEYQPVPSTEAMEKFERDLNDKFPCEKIFKNRSDFYFIPTDLTEKFKGMGEGIMDASSWDYPLRLEFKIKSGDDRELSSLQLRLFVGPFEGRDKLVECLRKEIGRPAGARADSVKYTQIWASSSKDVQDDSEEIFQAMSGLFSEYRSPGSSGKSPHQLVLTVVSHWVNSISGGMGVSA
ncbi:hypothetical protein EBZ70_10405 [bacterium]|nr:hypothetical protein [bacterium]